MYWLRAYPEIRIKHFTESQIQKQRQELNPCRCHLVCALFMEKTLKDIVIEALAARVPEIGAVCEIQFIRRAYSASYSYFPKYY